MPEDEVALTGVMTLDHLCVLARLLMAVCEMPCSIAIWRTLWRPAQYASSILCQFGESVVCIEEEVIGDQYLRWGETGSSPTGGGRSSLPGCAEINQPVLLC